MRWTQSGSLLPLLVILACEQPKDTEPDESVDITDVGFSDDGGSGSDGEGSGDGDGGGTTGGDEGGEDGGGSEVDVDDAYAACRLYVASLEECYLEAGISLEEIGYTTDTYCSGFEGIFDAALVELLLCYADIIEAADCSTEEGLDEMGTASAEECVP